MDDRHRLRRRELLRPPLLLHRRPGPLHPAEALKADIDEDTWGTLYQTTSRPFPAPSTGRIAGKVINDYGDEVVKTYTVERAGS